MVSSAKGTIVVVGGYWSTNIGNSFFQLGAKYILERVFPGDNIIMLSDQPGFWNTKIGNPSNAFNLLDYIKPDFFVILGPFLRSEIRRIWGRTLQCLYQKKVKVIVLGAGMMRYTKDEIKECRTLLTRFPPYILVSRDTETYNFFGDLANFSYDGIDPAFFVSDIFEPLPFGFPKYIILNFDQIPEPKINISKQNIYSQSFYFEGYWWSFKFPKLEYNMSKKYKAFTFIRAVFLTKNLPYNIGEFHIIRTDHRFNPMMIKKSYAGPNSFVSDIPYTYLNIYANTIATFTNRVHACIATLAYGKPAMLFSNTKRARLLERLGLNEITQKPVNLAKEKLQAEKDNLINFLKKVLHG